MDHGHHGHGGHDMPATCSVQMLWNTQIIDTCIVFPSWHIRSNTGFVLSCFAIVAMSVFYEYLREFQRKYDVRLACSLAASGKGKGHLSPIGGSGRSTPDDDYEDRGLLTGRKFKRLSSGTRVPLTSRIIRALLYGATIFLSFFLMLVFMSYNAYLVFSVVVGAALGHYIFGSTMNINAVLADGSTAKTLACH